MSLMMNPEMVYQYPIWGTGLLLISIALTGALALELVTRRLLPAEFRRRHHDVAAAIFSAVGVTYAVLLAFVAMLAWEGFNRAKAASAAEAAAVIDVHDAAIGLPDPQAAMLNNALRLYLRDVITVEWPAQAEGHVMDRGRSQLDTIAGIAGHLAPTDAGTSNRQADLLAAQAKLSDARQVRLASAGTTVPGIIWVVLVLGGALTVACCSFFAVPSLAMHLAMAATLTISGGLVLILIIALSNPFRGDFRVSTAPFDRALAEMQHGPP